MTKFKIDMKPGAALESMAGHFERLQQMKADMRRDFEERMATLNAYESEVTTAFEELSSTASQARKLELRQRFSEPEKEVSGESRYKLALAALAPASRNQYLSHLRMIDAALEGVELTDQRLAVYLESRFEGGKSPGSIHQDAKAARFRAKHMGGPDPFGEVSKAVMRRIRRKGRSRGNGRAKALLRPDVDKILRYLDAQFSLSALRDAACIHCMFDGMLRRSEASALIVSDLEAGSAGTGTLRIRFSKTDQDGDGAFVALGPDAYKRLCGWIEKSGMGASDPMFPGFKGYGSLTNKAISPKSIGNIVTKRAKAAGIEGVTGHSLRRGMAAELTERGFSIQAVADAGRWKDPAQVVRYTASRRVHRSAVVKMYQNGQGE